ncbi:MAG: 6-pyruvoyl trahydropterin synthase family protein [Nitrosopumilaceae archaeon]
MNWEITKSFSLCYGHRVHCQTINTDFTERGHNKPKCRHLHGHEGTVDVSLEADKLNPQGMVCDFVWLGWLKNFLDDNIDHKFIIDIHDPLFERITGGIIDSTTDEKLNITRFFTQTMQFTRTYDGIVTAKILPIHIPGVKSYVAGYTIDTTYMEKTAFLELYEGFVFVDFVPTSENLSGWLFDIVDTKMKQINVRTTKVVWWETPKSRSIYAA